MIEFLSNNSFIFQMHLMSFNIQNGVNGLRAETQILLSVIDRLKAVEDVHLSMRSRVVLAKVTLLTLYKMGQNYF